MKARAFNNGERGFTLFEMALVIGIFTVMLVISGPSLRRVIEGYQISQGAMSVYSDLMYAKMQAVEKQNEVIMIFRPADQEYDILYDFNSDWDGDELAEGDYYLKYGVTLTGGMVFATNMYQIVGVDSEGIGDGVTFNSNRIYFQPSGRAAEGHEDSLFNLIPATRRSVYLIQEGDAAINDYTYLRALVLDGITGTPVVKKYKGVWVTKN